MTRHGSIFNSIFRSDGPLEFREPSLASKIEREKGGEIVIPSDQFTSVAAERDSVIDANSHLS